MITESRPEINSEDESQASRENFPVALVAMPFISCRRPSIQIGLLKAIGESYGFPVTTFHFNLDLAERLGIELYEVLCDARGHQLGDWLFAKAAFGDEAPEEEAFLSMPSLHADERVADLVKDREQLYNLRSVEIPAYLEKLVEETDWSKFKVVGFTSTFQQNVTSFALAALLKRRYPHLVTVFGGANFEGDMGVELTRTIDCIDYAVIGEGDKAFPEFLIALCEGRDPAEIRGVVTRRNGQVTPLNLRPPLRTMDELPTPDYHEYFERAARLNLLPQNDDDERILLPFESSRGCWWGAKHQCTFCGLNGNGIGYRSKSPAKVRAELDELAKYYPNPILEAVDNILDLSYITTIFQQLTEEKPGYELFYEVKANLTRQQIKLLSTGGVTRIQPGIESLNSHVLKLMRKGISAIQNVNAMRWSAYYSIGVVWNILWGFPNETPEDYEAQVKLVPNLMHLCPPQGYGRIWMERFSPVYFEKENFPTRFVKPELSYSFVYPKKVDLDKIAYFFDYEFEDRLPDSTYRDFGKVIDRWRESWANETRPLMVYWTYTDFMVIEDLRNRKEPRTYTIDEPLASIYLALSEKPHTALAVKTKLDLKMSVSELDEHLQKMCEMGLVMKDGSYYLSLAIPGHKPRTAMKDGRIYFSRDPEADIMPAREPALVAV